MKNLLRNAYARLAARALVTGALVFGSIELAATDPLSKVAVLAAASAAAHAAFEILTPINALVGVGAQKLGVDPALVAQLTEAVQARIFPTQATAVQASGNASNATVVTTTAIAQPAAPSYPEIPAVTAQPTSGPAMEGQTNAQ